MAHTSCEIMWIKHLLEELRFVVKLPMTMHCDNQAAIYIASNPVFHEQTKHIEVDCHITQEKVENGVIATPYVSTTVQIADMFTKALCKTRLGLLCNKLGLYDIYSRSVMSNRGKTVISCTLYINNILCVRVHLSNPKTLSQ